MNILSRDPLMADNENGFALITAMMMLVVLTLIGIAATNTTVFELQVASNERVAYDRFHVADSAWKQVGPFLNLKDSYPKSKNVSLRSGNTSRTDALDALTALTDGDPDTEPYYTIVRNYGDGADGVLNDLFPAGSEDGSISNIPYWYRVVEIDYDSKAIGFGDEYGTFTYYVSSNAANTASIATRITKISKDE